MSTQFNRLREGLPSRSPPGRQSFPTEPRRVKEWVSALPRANPSVAHQQLTSTLQELRELRLDGGQRLAAMEVLRPAVLEAIELLDGQAQGGTLPLPPAKARAVAELRAFEEDLAYGYRLAVEELCAPLGAIPFLRGGSVAQATERAIFHQSRVLMRAYFLYSEPPDGSWSALHALFDFACSHKLEDKLVEEVAEEQQLTIRQLYSQAILLALANPYRFSQSEQGELWRASRDLANYLSLGSQRAGEDHFAVPVDSDRGPGFIPEERESGEGRLLWLDLRGARQLIEAPLAKGQSGAMSLRLKGGRTLESTVDLMRRFRAGWATAQERGRQRRPAHHTLTTVIGLNSLHFFLAGHMNFESFVQQSGSSSNTSDYDRTQWSQGAIDSLRNSKHVATVSDQSLGGYRLRWRKEENLRARIGEVVGLSVGSDDDARLWMVGVIRWLRHAADGSVDAGIGLLARRAQAIGLRNSDASMMARPVVMGVEYQPLKADPEHMHVIVAANFDTLLRRADVVRVESGEQSDDRTLGDSEEAPSTVQNPWVKEDSGELLLLRFELTSS